jgi:hypothetical protein
VTYFGGWQIFANRFLYFDKIVGEKYKIMTKNSLMLLILRNLCGKIVVLK